MRPRVPWDSRQRPKHCNAGLRLRQANGEGSATVRVCLFFTPTLSPHPTCVCLLFTPTSLSVFIVFMFYHVVFTCIAIDVRLHLAPHPDLCACVWNRTTRTDQDPPLTSEP